MAFWFPGSSTWAVCPHLFPEPVMIGLSVQAVTSEPMLSQGCEHQWSLFCVGCWDIRGITQVPPRTARGPVGEADVHTASDDVKGWGLQGKVDDYPAPEGGRSQGRLLGGGDAE